MASWEMVSIYPSSTTLSANNRSVHRTRPWGGSLDERAIKRASRSPSIFLRDTFCLYSRRDKMTSNPSSTNCLRTRSTVYTVTSKAPLIFSSDHPGPWALWSELSNILARVKLRAVPRPDVANFINIFLSFLDNRTTYFFTTDLKAFRVSKPLRKYIMK